MHVIDVVQLFSWKDALEQQLLSPDMPVQKPKFKYLLRQIPLDLREPLSDFMNIKHKIGAVIALLFYLSDRNYKRTYYMKKLNLYLLAMLFALMPALQSCDDDGYSIGDMGRDWATVRVLGGDAYYLEGDRWGKIWPGASAFWGFKPVDGQRVIAWFNPLYDNFQGYDVAVKMEYIDSVVTKGVEELTAENETEYGNDPVAIWQNDIWVGGNYLNVVFQQNRPNKHKHRASLVHNTMSETPDDGYIHLEYRYNTYKDLSGYWGESAVSFNLNSLKIDESTKGIKVKVNGVREGEVELTFDLRNTSVPESVKNMNYSKIQIDKLK